MTFHRFLNALGAYTLSDLDIQLYEELQKEPLADLGAAETVRDPLLALDNGQVRQAVDELPDVFKTPIVLHYLDGLSYQEIAAKMDLPVGWVRARIHRGRAYLLGCLSAAGSESASEQKKALDELALQLEALDHERERLEGSIAG